MNRLFSTLAAVTALAFSSMVLVTPASAVFIPIGDPVITVIPAKPATYKQTGNNNSVSGTAYDVATFCPKAAAPGTCTGATLSGRAVGFEKVSDAVPGSTTCVQPGINVTRGGISGGSKAC
jgi:hypothetical protein